MECVCVGDVNPYVMLAAISSATISSRAQTLRRLGRVMTTDEILMAPDSPLAPPPHARIVRLAVLRAEGNTTYGDCILPSFQQLFRAAAASLAGETARACCVVRYV